MHDVQLMPFRISSQPKNRHCETVGGRQQGGNSTRVIIIVQTLEHCFYRELCISEYSVCQKVCILPEDHKWME